MSGIPAVQLGLQLFFLTQGDLCGVQFCHIFLHLALQRYFIFLQLEIKHNTVIYMASRQDQQHGNIHINGIYTPIRAKDCELFFRNLNMVKLSWNIRMHEHSRYKAE